VRAGDIKGRHPRWQRYLNGPADRAALQGIRGIGPERSALLLRLFGSIDGFLQADPRDVATLTHGLIGERLAATLKARCVEAGLRSDWASIEDAHRAARPDERDLLDRIMALFPGGARSGETGGDRADRVRWTLTHVGRAWALTAPWGWESGGSGASIPPPGPKTTTFPYW